ncbi:MAG TPA: adenylate/guanylate cyclase domain-containing protein [Candidatus Micrarchaeaceae archaeon]|nr:adenylate/guanylate cyclase domain-containing protein [Candidatus Micrarchaeaceae archaeon]
MAVKENRASIRSTAVQRLGKTLQIPWRDETTAEMEALDNELIRRHQLERLLPSDAVDLVLAEGILPTAGDRRILTIMFVDIRGSAQIEETISPEGTIEFLNTYLGLAARAILAHHGSVNKFIGDGILAVFGVVDDPDHGASNAIAAATAIHAAFADESPSISTGKPIRAVVALHTGPAIVGVVGLAERADYAVLGSAVNIASRLEGEAKEMNLATALSGATVAALGSSAWPLRLVTTKNLRGLSERVDIWSSDPSSPVI